MYYMYYKCCFLKNIFAYINLIIYICSNPECLDPCPTINKMVHGRKIQWSSGDSGEETEDYDTPGTSTEGKRQVIIT